MKKTLIFFLLLCYSADTLAQNILSDGLIRKSSVGKPLLAEMHSSITKIECGYNKSYSEFDLLGEKSRFDRPMVELHLGSELPLFAHSTTDKSWHFAVRLPLSVHVLEDMWGPETAPVINTDYRFGAPRLVVLRQFSHPGFVKNMSLSWLSLFHECTHIGDEIVIYRMNRNFPITRINVSYEYTELSLMLNDPALVDGNCHSFRAGWLYRVSNRGLGWFSLRSGIEADESIVLPQSQYRSEFYGLWEWKRNSGLFASTRCQPVISFEGRFRPRYAYPIFSQLTGETTRKEVKERMEFCANLYAGYRFFPKEENTHSLGLFFHAYRGLNPFGQLRNYPGYPFFGVALTYEP